MGDFNAIPLYKLLSEAAKRHGDEVVWIIGAYEERTMAMEAERYANESANMITTRPLVAADNLERCALIALSLAKKLREK